jgi:hypothetical protein
MLENTTIIYNGPLQNFTQAGLNGDIGKAELGSYQLNKEF